MKKKPVMENETFANSLIGKILILAIALIIFILLLDKVVMPYYTRHGETIKMKKITGLDTLEAKMTLSKMNLIAVLEDSQYSEVIPPGEIILQRPLPGADIKRGEGYILLTPWGRGPCLCRILPPKG